MVVVIEQEELKDSYSHPQVIQHGQTAGFDIVVRSEILQDIQT